MVYRYVSVNCVSVFVLLVDGKFDSVSVEPLAKKTRRDEGELLLAFQG